MCDSVECRFLILFCTGVQVTCLEQALIFKHGLLLQSDYNVGCKAANVWKTYGHQ